MAGPKDKVTYTVEIDGAKAVAAAKEIADSLSKVSKAASDATRSLQALEAAGGAQEGKGPPPPSPPSTPTLAPTPPPPPPRRGVRLSDERALVSQRASERLVDLASREAREALQAGDIPRFRFLSRQVAGYVGGKRTALEFEPPPAALLSKTTRYQRYLADDMGVRAAAMEARAALSAGDLGRYEALNRQIEGYLRGDVSSIRKLSTPNVWSSDPAVIRGERAESPIAEAARETLVQSLVKGETGQYERITKGLRKYLEGKQDFVIKPKSRRKFIDFVEPDPETPAGSATPAGVVAAAGADAAAAGNEADKLLREAKGQYAKTLDDATKKQKDMNRQTEGISRYMRDLVFRGSVLSAIGGVASNIRQGLVEGVRSPDYAVGTMALGMAGGLGAATSAIGGGLFMRAPSLLSPMALAGGAITIVGQALSTIVDVISARVQRGREVIEASTAASGGLSEGLGFLTQGEFFDTSKINLRRVKPMVNPYTGYVVGDIAPSLSAEGDKISVEYTDPSQLGPGGRDRPAWKSEARFAQSLAAQITAMEVWRTLTGDVLGMTSDDVRKSFEAFSATPVLGLSRKVGGIYDVRDAIALARMTGTNVNQIAQLTALQAGGYFRTSAPILPPTNMGEISYGWPARGLVDALTNKESTTTALAGLVGAANYAGMRGDVLLNATLSSMMGARSAGLYGKDATGLSDTARFATSMAVAGVSGHGISSLISSLGGAKAAAATDITSGFAGYHKSIATLLALRKGPLQDVVKNLASMTNEEILEEGRRISPFLSEMALQAEGLNQADARAAGTGRPMQSYLAPTLLSPFTYGFKQVAAEGEAARADFATQTEAAAAALERLRVEADKTSAWWSKVFSQLNSNSYVPSMSGD